MKQLKGEIQELRKQLEQAREKQDDEALKELTDHLEASSAIVAAQTRDWVHFQEAAARNASFSGVFRWFSSGFRVVSRPFVAGEPAAEHEAQQELHGVLQRRGGDAAALPRQLLRGLVNDLKRTQRTRTEAAPSPIIAFQQI